MWIDVNGWCSAAVRVPTTHHEARPLGATIDLLVIHNISLPPAQFDGSHVLDFFRGTLARNVHPYLDDLQGVRVSAHFFLRRDGSLYQFVSTQQRAWHAGSSSWCGRDNCNDYSIGVELEGTDELPYADAQYRVLAALTRALCTAYPLCAAVGHSDIAPQRKTDPGAAFDWPRFTSSSGLLR